MQRAYIKFDLYLPARYKKRRRRKWSYVSCEEMLNLANNLREKFRGCTYSNPVATPSYQGMWTDKSDIEVDNIFLFTVLVEEDPNSMQDVLKFLEKCKNQLERKYCQDLVLITWHPIYAMGKL